VEPSYENQSARARYLISPSLYQIYIAINGENRITQYRSNLIRTPAVRMIAIAADQRIPDAAYSVCRR
jgi:hypothetical protein